MENLPPPMAARRPNFWQNSGYHLLAPDADGQLTVTDDFLRAYFNRPEVAPVEESCDKERALHAALLSEPKRSVSAKDIEALEDPDGRENYKVLIDFRDRLVNAGTVEGCYLDIFREGDVRIPLLFLDQMANVIIRQVLDGTDDPFRARAAELLFREQTVTVHEGSILSGDLETVEMLANTGGMGSIGKLLVEGGVKSQNRSIWTSCRPTMPINTGSVTNCTTWSSICRLLVRVWMRCAACSKDGCCISRVPKFPFSRYKRSPTKNGCGISGLIPTPAAY